MNNAWRLYLCLSISDGTLRIFSPHHCSAPLGFLPTPHFKAVNNLCELTRASGHFRPQFIGPLGITQPCCCQFLPLGTLSSLSLGDMALAWLWSSSLALSCLHCRFLCWLLKVLYLSDGSLFLLYSLHQRFPSDLCLSLYSDDSQVYFLQPETNHGAQATDTLLTLRCLTDTSNFVSRPNSPLLPSVFLTLFFCIKGIAIHPEFSAPISNSATSVFPATITSNLVLVAQLHLTLYDIMDCSLPGSSVHGIP